jgi:hypothetical protein
MKKMTPQRLDVLGRTLGRTRPAGECYNWTGNSTQQVRINGGRVRVTRAVYEAYHGVQLPDSVDIVRTCGNRKCINPLHLTKRGV